MMSSKEIKLNQLVMRRPVYIYNGILLSYKNECIQASPNEVEKPRAYYKKWSKSERERQILYINTYVWNLEK